MGIKEDFQAIFDAWNKGESYSDVFHQILEWLLKYEYKELDQVEEAVRLYMRIEKGEEMKEIVADFIDGKACAELRETYLH